MLFIRCTNHHNFNISMPTKFHRIVFRLNIHIVSQYIYTLFMIRSCIAVDADTIWLAPVYSTSFLKLTHS